MSHRRLRRRVSLSIIAEATGVCLVFAGTIMYVMPIDNPLFFEFYIGNVDFAPMIVGIVGGATWRAGSAVRHEALKQTHSEDRKIRAEFADRRRDGRDNDAEFLARLEDAANFHALRQKVIRAYFYTVFATWILFVGSCFVGAIFAYRWFGLGIETAALLAVSALALLALLRHYLEHKPSR